MVSRCLAHEVVATVGHTRSFMSLLSNMPAMQDFLDIPSKSDRPSDGITRRLNRVTRRRNSILGNITKVGQEHQKNEKTAVMWYRKSAEQGFASAQCKLATCFMLGKGVEKSKTEAVKWIRKSAEAGNADGIKYLAACYHIGAGVKNI
jgi:TPR repeat protein